MALPAAAQSLNQLEALLNGPWHSVGAQQPYEKARAACNVVGAQTIVTTSSTPAVTEYAQVGAIINCLKASGYAPGAPTASAAAKPKSRPLQTAGGGVGVSLCAEFTKARGKVELEAMFFSWAEGYLTGWNSGVIDDSSKTVEMSALSRTDQMQYIRTYCDTHPDHRYMQAVMALKYQLGAAK